MGMYICDDCAEQNLLRTEICMSAISPCEICGPVRNSWGTKGCSFTWDITRLANPVPEQLREYKTSASEVGGRGVDRPNQVTRAFL